MNYLEFDFETKSAQQSEQLIALLNEQGFDGFEEEEDCNLKAYIHEEAFNEEAFSDILTLFTEIIYTKTIVEHINWNKKWETDFKPVIIDNYVAVRAGFHQPIRGMEHEIIITPKMSFGTGHHATTHLMIQQMQGMNFAGKSVLDFGTGTGILAILAEKSGASSVLAIDYDEWSITNTIENIQQNECSKIEVLNLDKIPQHIKFDIILANINLNVILNNVTSIVNAANVGCQILMSGFLKENEFEMIQALEKVKLTNIKTSQRGDWITLFINSV
ncbi:50S ribosomal protein L11 methyltransferase [soil metagenome]